MRKFLLVSLLLSGAILASVPGSAGARARPAPNRQRTEPFAVAKIYLEYNATDQDMGVHIDSDHEDGLRSLRIKGPGGVMINQTWRSRPKLGLTEMKTESAEPNIKRALRAYPPGVYSFSGVTISGRHLASRATLSHELLDPPSIASPADGSTLLPVNGVTVSWTPVAGAVGYAFEVADETEGAAVKLDLDATLEPTTTSFRIPDGVLKPGTPYSAGAAAIHENGNQSLSVVTFTTAG